MSTQNKENSPFGSPARALEEKVMQSADAAVLSNPASVGGLPNAGFASDLRGPDGSVPRAPKVDQLAKLVSEKPVLYALVAFAAGAALAALVRSAVQRRCR